jgi:MoaA/NifB/PqqE/SkfB family radical SAM enzyme
MCTLKCPRCSRTEFINQFPKQWKNKSLNLEHLKNFLDIDLKNKTMSLSGTYGDSIYYNQLFDMIDYFKNAGAAVNISTNGSYKTVEWWKELSSRLDEKDKIIFAIDGVPENFTQYRINADWSTISEAVNVLKTGTVKLSWQYILFSYNENTVDAAKQLSLDMGFDDFFVMQSTRWDHGKEWLTPNASLEPISQSKIIWKKHRDIVEVNPKCKRTNYSHYISADGFYTPCCHVAEHRFYYKYPYYLKGSINNKINYSIVFLPLEENKTRLFINIANDIDMQDFFNYFLNEKLNFFFN